MVHVKIAMDYTIVHANLAILDTIASFLINANQTVAQKDTPALILCLKMKVTTAMMMYGVTYHSCCRLLYTVLYYLIRHVN